MSTVRQTIESKNSQIEASKESLYRTKWLMAHNHLHDLVHDRSLEPAKVWDDYLRELGTAEAVAKIPA